MDGATGVVLYRRDMHARRPVASTTKIMTALVALEEAEARSVRGSGRGRPRPTGGRTQRGGPGSAGLDEWATVSEKATQVEPSSLALKPGERMRLNDLLAALLLKSANDAAIVIAEHVSSRERAGEAPPYSASVSAFAARMNARARELGARDTHFTNPHGLSEPDHYSSAYDLGLMTREALRHPRFRELVATKAAEVFRPDVAGGETVENHNKLLWRADYVDGVKTGWVSQSGQCIVASATKDGWQLIAVLLDSPDKYDEALALLDYGFGTFRRRILAEKGDVVARAQVRRGRKRTVPAVCSEMLAAVTGPGLLDAGRLEVKTLPMTAPVPRGAPVGEARLIVGGQVVGASPLLAGEAVAVSRPVLFALWALRAAAFLALAAITVRTSAKLVKARRRRGRGVSAQGRRPDPRRPGAG